MSRHLCSVLVLGSLLVLGSCLSDPSSPPAAADKADSAPVTVTTHSETQTLINNFLVQYDGRTFDGEATTFRYTVTGTGDVPTLNQFRLELPDCAGELSGFAPTEEARFAHVDGIYYIKWFLDIEGDDTVGRQYAITFPGDVPQGAIHSAVVAGGTMEVGQVPGPCAGYLIAGAVYIDADEDGARDADESGIANVAVELLQPDGSVLALLTDPLGDFAIMRTAGDYTLRIVYDGYPDAFNAELQASFAATTPLEIPVTVGPDATDNLFGFSPVTDTIIEDLVSGDLYTNGYSVKWWRQQVKWALDDVDHPDVVYDREELEAFLAAIEELHLPEIFQFTPGHELEEAYDILRLKACDSTNDCDPLEILRQELLATELSDVSGFGLVDDPALQDVLIAWGEAVWVENLAAARAASPLGAGHGDDPGDVGIVPDYQVPPAIEIFKMINTGGGGGVDEKR